MMNKPYSESCDQNREPILAVLKHRLNAPGLLLEIGSGTGQHAAWMPAFLPHIRWQPSDVAGNLPGIRLWCDEVGHDNLLPAVALDVGQADWPVEHSDYVFSANTAHIMSWALVEKMFEGVGRVLDSGGQFCLYGPFNYGGSFSSESNARFEQWLKGRDPLSGIRDLDDLLPLAERHGLVLEEDIEMPVNNRVLVFRR